MPTSTANKQTGDIATAGPQPRLTPVTSAALENCAGIHNAFFTRAGGVSQGLYAGLNAGLGSNDARADVVENRRRMAAHLGASFGDITSPYQVHSADVVTVSEPISNETPSARPKADGLVTATDNLPIGIVTADCGPVLFADPEARVIGAAHAGWKGALTGVLQNTIAAMEALGAVRSNITAVLGPMICQANYEVGPDFPTAFLDQSAKNARYFVPSNRADHHRFDLPAYIIDQLLVAGVKAESVTANGVHLCTYQHPDQFFSYRRTTHRKEPDYGRQMSAIMLRQDTA
ncbi:MAG: peptidoglycan editing factor PgeF [Pseudomonadota bacterium]